MKIFILTLFLVCMFMMEAQNSIQIGNQVMKTGVQEIKHNFNMEMQMQSKMVGKNEIMNQNFAGQAPQVFTNKLVTNKEQVVTILDADDLGAKKIKIHFRRDEKSGMEEYRSVVEGKTYLVEKNAGKLVVTSAEGQEVSSQEKQDVAQMSEEVLEKNPFAEAFAGRTFAMNSQTEIPQALAQKLLKSEEEEGSPRVQKFVLTLRETKVVDEVKCALFDASIFYLLPMQTKAEEMKGKMLVGIDTGWVHSVDMASSSKIEQSRDFSYGKIEVSGTQDMKMQYQMKYQEK